MAFLKKISAKADKVVEYPPRLLCRIVWDGVGVLHAVWVCIRPLVGQQFDASWLAQVVTVETQYFGTMFTHVYWAVITLISPGELGWVSHPVSSIWVAKFEYPANQNQARVCHLAFLSDASSTPGGWLGFETLFARTPGQPSSSFSTTVSPHYNDTILWWPCFNSHSLHTPLYWETKLTTVMFHCARQPKTHLTFCAPIQQCNWLSSFSQRKSVMFTLYWTWHYQNF